MVIMNHTGNFKARTGSNTQDATTAVRQTKVISR